MIKNKGNFEKAKQELKNDQNNSVVFVFEEENKNSGSLKNATFTIKDVFATQEKTTQASSLSLLGFQPSYNATVVEKLLNAGANAVAKVHNDELALGGEGIYSHWGVIKNPLDSTRKVGGSSSGSAATLTENISFALGSDTGDSVRLPASFIGKVGFKPSYGAVSRYGMFAYASSLDTVAWFAHNVNDIYEVAKVAYGFDEKDFTSKNISLENVKETKPKNVLYLDIFEFLSDDVSNKYKEFLNQIQDKVNLIPFKPDLQILEAIKPVYDIISYSEAASNLANINGITFGNRQDGNNWEEIMTNTRSVGFGKMVQRRLILGSYFLEKDNQKELFLRAQKIRRLIKNYYVENFHTNVDLVIFPASSDVAPKFDENRELIFMDYILTGSNLVGNPSLTLKLGTNKDKLPFNLTLETGIYKDANLLSYALWIEKELEKIND